MLKRLSLPGVFVVMLLIGCGTLTSPETREERERFIAAHDALQEKYNPERVKESVKDLLVGRWQYVGLAVEEGRVSVQPGQGANPPGASTDATQVKPPAPGSAARAQTEPELPNPTAERLPPIEVEDGEEEQEMLAAKAALVASTRKNLTLEFTEDRSSYYYSGSNRGRQVTGQCSITTKRYGDEPLPFISFNRQTGPEMVEFLFGAEPVKEMVARKKREDAERLRRMGAQGARRASAKATYSIASLAGVNVTADTLTFILYGDMELTPKGWIRTGGLRCTFKRIE